MTTLDKVIPSVITFRCKMVGTAAMTALRSLTHKGELKQQLGETTTLDVDFYLKPPEEARGGVRPKGEPTRAPQAFFE